MEISGIRESKNRNNVRAVSQHSGGKIQTNAMDYLSLKNLRKYQHYSHRNPPWIKLYREFWTDYTVRSLTPLQRLLFLGLMTLAAELENQIPHDARYLSDRLGLKVAETDISTLLSSTLLSSTLKHTSADNMLAGCTQDASEISKTLSNGRNYRDEAVTILAFLNQKSGKSFRAVPTNLSLIEARLRTGVDLQSCKSLIARKVRDWSTDPKMQAYLRPETLFNKTKFESYLAEVTS